MNNDNIFFDTSKLKYVGANVIIGKTVRIRHPELVEIGDNCIIDDFTYISTELRMGKSCHIASGVNISGGGGRVILGNYVAIAAGCSLHAATSDYISASLDYPSVPRDIRFGGYIDDIELKDFVLLGAHTVVMPGVILPEGFASAAKTIIRNKKYDNWSLYGGEDAGLICKRSHKKISKLKDEKIL
jgi:acetyltransferase-like isoleucine patch superfamily enzyme